MSSSGSNGDGSKKTLTPHLDFDHDPNLPGEGQRIRDLVEMERLDTIKLVQIAKRIDVNALLKATRDLELEPGGKFSIIHGNKDIVALIESGVFQFNPQGLRDIVKQIHFSHPNGDSISANSSRAFVDALVASDALQVDLELPDVILNRRDMISNAENAQFLIEAIEAGFFENRPDLLEAIVEKIQEARTIRDANPALREGNGYWEHAMRRIEQPVINALAELGTDVRAVKSMSLDN